MLNGANLSLFKQQCSGNVSIHSIIIQFCMYTTSMLYSINLVFFIYSMPYSQILMNALRVLSSAITLVAILLAVIGAAVCKGSSLQRIIKIALVSDLILY